MRSSMISCFRLAACTLAVTAGASAGEALAAQSKRTMAAQPVAVPAPVAGQVSIEQYWVGRSVWLRVALSIDNRGDFDQALFRSELGLGPCPGGLGTGRIQVVVQHALLFNHLAGFCPNHRNELGSIKATMRKSGALAHVMISMTDRLTNQTVQSGVVFLVLRPAPTGVRPGTQPVSPN